MNIHSILEEAIIESIKADPNMAPWHDWHYRDLPRMTPRLMTLFREQVGEENLKWITFADYGESQRGQVLISPEGMVRITEWSKSAAQ